MWGRRREGGNHNAGGEDMTKQINRTTTYSADTTAVNFSVNGGLVVYSFRNNINKLIYFRHPYKGNVAPKCNNR